MLPKRVEKPNRSPSHLVRTSSALLRWQGLEVGGGSRTASWELEERVECLQTCGQQWGVQPVWEFQHLTREEGSGLPWGVRASSRERMRAEFLEPVGRMVKGRCLRVTC